MEIVVRGRNVEVPDHYRQHVEDKVGQLERFDGKLSRIDVELFHEKNPRQSANCQRVEITLRGKGPVVRAEASAPDFHAALDLACGKLDNRLRRANDRRRVHHGRRTPPTVRVSGTTAAVISPVTTAAIISATTVISPVSTSKSTSVISTSFISSISTRTTLFFTTNKVWI